MKRVTDKIKPVSGFSHVLHLLLTVILPLSVYVLVRLEWIFPAILLVILSKWRIFSVRPRYWIPLIRANAIDIIVGISTVVFMVNTKSGLIQLIWAVAYTLWLVLIKPSSTVFGVSMQAFIAFLYGLMAVYLEWSGSQAVALMVMTWIVSYAVARHFLTSFNEAHSSFLANTWALFGASLAWLLSYDLLYFKAFSQVTVLLVVLGFGLATLYYLDKTDKQNNYVKAELIFLMLVTVILNVVILIIKGSGRVV